MTATTSPPSPPSTPGATPRARRWPRRLAIGVVVTGALVGGAAWLLGRESTLQLLVQKLASASGGNISASGVSGSLVGAMHITHLVYRTPEQLVTIDNIDIDWSPLQFFSNGVEVNKLTVASLRKQTLKPSPPATMPTKITPPFAITVSDARLAKVDLDGTVIADVRFQLHGDGAGWQLNKAAATTPWGKATAAASIAGAAPFKVAGSASLLQTAPAAGQQGVRVNVTVGGDLRTTTLAATAQLGKAAGDAALVLAPFATVPLRALTLHGRGIDPGFFNPALPTADLALALSTTISDDSRIDGSISLTNGAPAGTLDEQRLPLRAIRATIAGTLSAAHLKDVLIDLGAAGKLTGTASLARTAQDKGLGSATFALHTERIDLKAIHASLRATRIAGDIKLANIGATQTLDAQLADGALRLDVQALLANELLQLKQARLSAGGGSVRMAGSMGIAGTRPFKVNAVAAHFNPAALGSYGVADINADINASGALSPQWQVAAEFALKPSTLFKQALSGKGKLNADAAHISGVDATLALGQNTALLRGSFGAPGEQLQWRVDGKQLAALRSDLIGAATASGVVTGTMAAPRTSFVVDATGIGMAKAARAPTSALHASGEAWLAGGSVEVKTSGTLARLNPAAFGPYMAGSINGAFDASARAGSDWRGALKIALQPSTLSNAPLFGRAELQADARHLSNADVELHLGPNLVKGAFGLPAERLDWRLDAPQLAVLGADYGGVLRGAGVLTGSLQAPALEALIDGQALRFGAHQLQGLHATASLGSGRGGADPVASDITLTNYRNGDTRVASARMQTSGTRAAHALTLALRNDDVDFTGAIRGGWNANTWTGSIDKLDNKGRYAVSLRAPAALRIAGPADAGVAGLLHPEQIALGSTVLQLADGVVTLQSLTKNGGHWTTKGGATGVPLNYLAQFAPALRENLAGDLAIGADWSLDMQAGATPTLNGSAHVFREKGDLIVGAEVPVVLGLRLLDLRADVAGSALRVQAEVDGVRAGHARVDASAQLREGRVGNDSPLTLTANADMGSVAWLAPLSGQPGLELDGALKLALTGSGSVGAPVLNGSVNGDKLALRWTDQGVKLKNGVLRAQLAGDQLLLQRLSFDGDEGTLAVDGALRYTGGETSVQLKVVADKLEILSRPDRTVVVSGQAALVRDARRFTLDGKIRADRALIELAPQGRPTLSDDVIVLGRDAKTTGAPAKGAVSQALVMDLEADMGDAFHLRGMGIDADLSGVLRVRAAGGRAPRVNGSIRVANGTYAAYGQKLAIDRGVISFNGAYDNPSLNIVALRKRPDGEQLSDTNVEAGVEVRGTALAPVAKLVSTPSVTDSEKLAWLVLGHGMESTSGNDTGVLSAAAGALLGGGGGSGGLQSRLANSLGVDELGLGQAKGLESTVVTVGKRISSRAYLSFEQGASTASSLVKLRYKLNPRVTLQFQTGTNTALDVLYSWAFD
jgi:translocation and assembly module TamB